MQIRRATEADVDALAQLLRDAFAEYERLYTRAGYAATTPDGPTIRARFAEGPTWVAHEDGRILGAVSAVAREGGVYVRSMAVAPAARGERIALHLMRQLELFAVSSKAPRLFLSTTPFLFSAIRLYEALGFRRTGEPPDDLHGTPLVTMARPLSR
ncbi:MAG: GNAT family N-acetyltransferase [Chloroflexota bacterium]|nr:GNAT family N-acetyltransferase [Chloroflexota bacterium]